MSVEGRFPADIIGLSKSPPLSRRTFMSATAAAAAGYTLAAGPVRADAITTDTTGLDVGDDTVAVAAGQMPIYWARKKDVRDPAVVLVAMEVFGLHAYIKDVVRRLAKAGYLAIAPNYYFTKGDLTQISDLSQLMPLVNTKPDAELVTELDATVAWARANGSNSGADKLGIIGFCRGGRSVWVYCAHSDKVKAGVAFYGSLVDPASQKAIWPASPIELASRMKAPVLGLYGADDQGIPPTQVEQMKAALETAGKTAEFKIYPGAGHGFHADYRPTYRQDAAEDAWKRALAWFEDHGVNG